MKSWLIIFVLMMGCYRVAEIAEDQETNPVVETEEVEDTATEVNFEEPGLPPCEGVITIADPAIEEAIRGMFPPYPYEGGITAEMMSQVVGDIDIRNRGITDLTGLHCAVNLDYLLLDGNPVQDFSPLAEMKNLDTLGLAETGVQDISFLSGLSRLKTLYLGDNRISDITPLHPLMGLQYLELQNNQVVDISALEGLDNLKSIHLNGNEIEDISVFSDFNQLTYLNLNFNQVSDTSPLEGLMNLFRLELEGNNVSDVYPLYSLSGINTLNLDDNEVVDIEPLAFEVSGLQRGDYLYLDDNKLDCSDSDTIDYLFVLQERGVTVYHECEQELSARPPTGCSGAIEFPDANLEAEIRYELGIPEGDITYEDTRSLTQLDLSFLGIEDITGLQCFTGLISLSIYANKVVDISPIQNLREIKSLDLDSNLIADITPVQYLHNLTYLQFGANAVQDISVLNALKNLVVLSMQDNAINDISSLRRLDRLEYIYASFNSITDLSPLEDLTDLVMLDLSENRITDLSPLGSLLNLIHLSLNNNPIGQEIAPLSSLGSLTQLSLNSIELTDPTPIEDFVGIGDTDILYLDGNPFDCDLAVPFFDSLASKGVRVSHDSCD